MTAHRQGADCEAQWVITKQESPETEVLTADGTRRQGQPTPFSRRLFLVL
jgi:hypothetical protein